MATTPLERALPAERDEVGPRARRRTLACVASAPSNPYLRLLHASLEGRGVDVVDDVTLSFRWLWRQRRSVDYLHFHWQDGFSRFEGGPAWVRPALSWAKTGAFGLRLAAARALGYRIVWTVHQVQPHEQVSPRREKAASVALARAAHVLVAHDAATAQQVASELRPPPERVAIVPHGPYTGTYPAGAGRDALRGELGIPDDAFVFLAFGEIRRYKRLDLLLDAFSQARLDRARLVVAGHPKDASVAAELRERAARDPRIELLLERVPEERVSDLFAASDAAVMARSDGGTSGALMLALSLGTPVVTADADTYDDLTLGGSAGWLFRAGDVESLAAALEAAAADPLAAAERGRTALAAADRVSWGQIGEQLDGLLGGAPGPAAAPAALRVGLVAPLPPQLGGVASVAGWLLGHEREIGCRYDAFDLWRPSDVESGGRLRTSSLGRQLRLLGRFAAWARRAPRVVHYCACCSFTGGTRDLAFVALLRLAGRRVIVHVHGAEFTLPGPGRRYHAAVVRLTARLGRACVAIAPSAVRWLADVGVPARAVLNPIRFDVANLPARTGAATALRLLFVGNYGRRKGTSELVEALAAVRAAGLDARLRLVGKEMFDGEERELRDAAARAGVADAVEFAGLMPPERLPEAYLAADVLCLPSWQEVLPMAILEAMSFGLPVVASAVGAIPDVVEDGRSGLLVPPKRPDLLAAAIQATADRGTRASMGAAARARVLELAAPERIAAEWHALYEEQSRS